MREAGKESEGKDTLQNEKKERKKRKSKKISNTLKRAIMDLAPMSCAVADGDTPECFGHYIAGHKCDCPYEKSCRFYTYDNMAERSRQNKWERFLTVHLDEQMDWQQNENGEMGELDLSANEFKDGKGRTYSIEDVNIPLFQTYVWLAIESPETARALMMRINPNVKSLQDMADLLGVTKQAIHKRIASELELEKRHKNKTLLKLSGKELDIYKKIFNEKKSIRQAARELNLPLATVYKRWQSIKDKGLIQP